MPTIETSSASPVTSGTTTQGSRTSQTRATAKRQAASPDRRERVFIRLSSVEKERAEYWSEKRGYASVNEYIAEAVSEKIRRESLDFDIPDLLTARINQVVDEVRALSTNSANLERVVTQGFDSLVGLTRGDNYLLDEENGELS